MHDFAALIISVRNKGVSIGDISKNLIKRKIAGGTTKFPAIISELLPSHDGDDLIV